MYNFAPENDINTNKAMKKIFTLSILALMPLLAMADDQKGTCGDNLTWTYTESTKTLTIEGTGKMYDYSMEAPWNTHSTSIQTIEIGDGVTSIGQGAFVLCYSMTSVSIPNSVTKIGEGAFTACGALTSITIPANVSAIDGEAFLGCIFLTDIKVEATTPPALQSNVFSNISDDAKIHVPAGTEDAYKTSWSAYADMIVGPDTGINDIDGNQRKSADKAGAIKNVKNGQLFIKTPDGKYTISGARSE